MSVKNYRNKKLLEQLSKVLHKNMAAGKVDATISAMSSATRKSCRTLSIFMARTARIPQKRMIFASFFEQCIK